MTELNQKLFEVCHRLFDLGIATSDNHISRLMNKSPRYLSWVKAADHDPDIAAMNTLYLRLDEIYFWKIARGEPGIAIQLNLIANDLWAIIKKASLERTHNARKQKHGN